MTRKRADWVGNRNTTLRGTPMRVNEAFSNRMANDAEKMVRKMHLDVSSQVNGLFGTSTAKQSIPDKPEEITTESVAMDASISVKSKHLMNKLIRKWEKSFNLFGDNFSKKMVDTVSNQSAKDLKKSTEKLSGGMNIKTDSLSDRTRDIIIASTDESASLMKTIASDYTTEVKEAVLRSISTNTGSLTSLREAINETLQGKYKTYRNKAKNNALDQTRKAYSNIAASRMRDVGLDKYVWRPSGGAQKPNHYHRNTLAGNTYSLSNPPVIDQRTKTKGKPGDWYGCGCYMEPVIYFD